VVEPRNVESADPEKKKEYRGPYRSNTRGNKNPREESLAHLSPIVSVGEQKSAWIFFAAISVSKLEASTSPHIIVFSGGCVTTGGQCARPERPASVRNA